MYKKTLEQIKYKSQYERVSSALWPLVHLSDPMSISWRCHHDHTRPRVFSKGVIYTC